VIARTWRGWTAAGDADAYETYLRQTGLHEYAATPGNKGAFVLRRILGDRAEFFIVSLWDSLDAIHGFAGGQIDRAVFYPEDDRFLVERELDVDHYEVLDPAWPAAPDEPA
jgi:heme-degrading monooxygenase HmoA